MHFLHLDMCLKILSWYKSGSCICSHSWTATSIPHNFGMHQDGKQTSMGPGIMMKIMILQCYKLPIVNTAKTSHFVSVAYLSYLLNVVYSRAITDRALCKTDSSLVLEKHTTFSVGPRFTKHSQLQDTTSIWAKKKQISVHSCFLWSNVHINCPPYDRLL
jgi:hypothetical protein